MLSCRNRLFIVFALVLAGCKPSSFTFREETQLNNSLFNNIWKLAGIDSVHLDSVTTFRARLEEQVIDRNDVSEYKLINDRSKKSNVVNFPVEGNYQHLYLFVLHTRPAKNLCIFLSTGFNADGECTGLGPAYLGYLRQDQINFMKELRIRESDSVYRFQSYGGKGNTVLHFYLDRNQPVQQMPEFRVYQIIRNVPNKVSGLKPVIYNVKTIFNDGDALLFARVAGK